MEAKNTQQDVGLRSQINTFSSTQETGSIFTPRSSNLSLPKSFTDLDKDRACREGFGYVTRYFENSLSEFKKRNSGVDYEFHQLDANAISCAIYINGSRAGQCGIWRNNDRNYGGGEICYGQDGIARNSYNECLTITDNGQTLGFRPLMGGYTMSSSRETLLTNEGMAEHLWDMFFNQIKQGRRLG
ncbi:Uncharacterised protein [Aeromonas salmonicida]|nr:Uncharacterised protein [Aeromonas salmonicida]SUU73020.1 Uncharacterised protein [Aeromonas salmonicida]